MEVRACCRGATNHQTRRPRYLTPSLLSVDPHPKQGKTNVEVLLSSSEHAMPNSSFLPTLFATHCKIPGHHAGFLSSLYEVNLTNG
jgi:hypothetical protein